MAILRLHKYGSPVLREKAMPVTKIDDEIKELVNNMIETMYAEGGAGLAAPQVGVSKKIIVIDTEDKGPIVLINPEIVKREGETSEEEGCLSVPGIYSPVKRSYSVTVEAIDLDEKKIQITREGFLAIALQHEIDHLEGYLFIDRLGPAKRIMIKNQLKEIK
ncbi:MAG: peptide deformylase [Candidatus Caldatribacteriota bacterium]|jgi:peptide deformylase|nr:peptide deformylase [Atribacterota bacterium]MDD3032101.1 peptide deformylase [Atribacterota bacterium]MDD3640540.1 peptide deformylase [Atribacterota bacterium]MDD4764732.1 peptide deformylase [Atribacterota bacterium]